MTEAALKNVPTKESDIEIAVTVTNKGSVDIEEVIQLYIKDMDSPLAVRNYSLCGFKRISLKAGETRTIDMTVNNRAMMVVDEEGERSVEGKNFTLYAGISQPDDVSMRLTGTAPAVIKFAI